MKEPSKALKIEATTMHGARHLISPLRDRTVNDLSEGIRLAGPDGIVMLKGADGNFVGLMLDNLATIEGEEVEVGDSEVV